MSTCLLKRTSWIVMVAFFVASFIAGLPRPSYADLGGKLIKDIAGYGVAGLVMVYLVATAGVTGAAAVVTALAALGGPFGMLGGVVVLILLKEIAEALAEYGMKKILRSVADELRKQGKSNSEIRKEIIDMPLITDTAKNQILREIGIY